jgi:predicted nucleic acid-binding protein
VIVVDASVLVELVLQTPRGRQLARWLLLDEEEDLHAPHLITVEAAQALRRLRRDGLVTAGRSDQAVTDLLSLRIERHSHEILLPRAWQLRDNLTIYDAVYVALAEILEAPLVTCDARLARAPGLSVQVEVV